MTQQRKNLKIASILVLVYAAWSLIKTVIDLIITDFSSINASENVLLVSKIIVVVLTAVLLLPELFIGLKGLKIAKDPTSYTGKAHIVWAIVLLVLALIAWISPIAGLIKQEAVASNLTTLGTLACDTAILALYLASAKSVAKAN